MIGALSIQETIAQAAALFNRGVQQSDQGDLAGAAESYREAIAVYPRLHQARINAGLVAERQQQDAEAARHWLSVAEAVVDGQADAVPFATIALNHLGRLQESRRQYAAGESALAHSLRLNPAQPDAIQHWVHLRQKQCTWPVYAPLPGITMNRLMAATSPLAMLALLDDPAMQWLTASSFVTRKYREAETPLGPGRSEDRPLPPGDRLRIGYLSGDLCTHAVGLLMAEVLEAHDRTRVHVTAPDGRSGRQRGVHRHIRDPVGPGLQLWNKLRLVSPARAIAEVAATAPAEPAVVLADAAMYAGLVDRRRLNHAVNNLDHGSRRALQVLGRLTGSASIAESRLRFILADAGLPTPSPSPPPDTEPADPDSSAAESLWFPDERTVVEFEPRFPFWCEEFEPSTEEPLPEPIAADPEGPQPVEHCWISWTDLTDPPTVADRIRTTFARAARRTGIRPFTLARM